MTNAKYRNKKMLNKYRKKKMINKFTFCTISTCLTIVSFSANSAMITFNSSTTTDVDVTRNNWLSAVGIVAPQYLVDFETGFIDNQNISGVSGLFPGGLIISDTSGANMAMIEGTLGGLGGSNPVGNFALEHNELAYLEIDFSSNPVDYFGFRDIDSSSTSIIVTFVGGSTDTFLLETTGAGGDSAEFVGIFRNDQPQITRIQFDAAGDASWGIDNLEYGVTAVPLPAAVWLFGSGLLGLVGLSKRSKLKNLEVTDHRV